MRLRFGSLLLAVALGLSTLVFAQNPVSVVQLNTTAVDTSTGNASAGTQRVVLATNQPNVPVTFTMPSLVAGTALIGHVVTVDGSNVPIFTSAAALGDTFNPTVGGIATYLMGWDNASGVWSRVQMGDSTGVLLVDASQFVVPVDASQFVVPIFSDDGNSITTIQGTTALSVSDQPWWTQLSDGTTGPVAVKAANTAVTTSDKALVVGISPNTRVTVDQGAGGDHDFPWFTSPTDPINGLSPAVKAGSTAATFADQALVVAISPNNTLPNNLTQIGGSTVDTNSGAKANGTLRVVIATDQPALTNKLLVTPDSVALPANQSVNVNQLAGTTTATNSGNTSAGTLRVVEATDAPQMTKEILNRVSISSNESVAAPTAAVWYIRRQWALPASAHFQPTVAWAAVTTAGSRSMVNIVNNLGNLNLSTNTFTAANSVASPYHYARLFGCVTTVMSATADTITPTYTDDQGNSQAATGVAFASASPVGNCYEFPLAATTPASALDTGVRAVTAASDSAAPTGVVTFYGVNPLMDTVGPANTLDQVHLGGAGNIGELNANEQIMLLLMQAATTAQQRSIGISGTLR